jgi:hypothetical protein
LLKITTMKICRVCKETKDFSLFPKREDSKDGYKSECKQCGLKRLENWRKQNLEKAKESQKKYVKENREKITSYQLKWQKGNIEKSRQYAKNWREKHPDKAKEKWKRYKKKYPEKVKIQKQKSRQELQHSYIKGQLLNKGFKSESITPELIEVQTLIIKTKRLCKTLQS